MYKRLLVGMLTVVMLLVGVTEVVGQEGEWELTETFEVEYTEFKFFMDYPASWIAEMDYPTGQSERAVFINELESDYELAGQGHFATSGYSIQFTLPSVVYLIRQAGLPLDVLDNPNLEALLNGYTELYGYTDIEQSETVLFDNPALHVRATDGMGNAVSAYFGWLNEAASYYLSLAAPMVEELEVFLPTWEAMLASIQVQRGWIAIEGKSLFYECAGQGAPTVVFESAFNFGFAEWTQTSQLLKDLTHFCVYSRWGTSPSDSIPGGVPYTIQDQVNDLVTMLEQLDIPQPVVVVGHGQGGLNITVLTDQYPEMVAGIVLVDALHPMQHIRELETNPGVDVIADVGPNWVANFEQVAATSQSFGDRPLAILVAGNRQEIWFPNFPLVYEPLDFDIWDELLVDYKNYSSNSRYIVLEDAEFTIPTTHSEAVIEAILWVLEELEAED